MFSLTSRRLQTLPTPTNHHSATFSVLSAIRNKYSAPTHASPMTIVPSIPPTLTFQASSTPRPEPEFWRQIAPSSPFEYTSLDNFLSWEWNTKHILETEPKLYEFLDAVIPNNIPRARGIPGMQTRDEFKSDIAGGIIMSTMSVRVTPYVLSVINWRDPANCPILRQFIPLKSAMMEDHPRLGLDSLHEQADSPVEGVVHRYPDKALFLPLAVCPVYCVFCTRSYGVGADTILVTKRTFKLARTRLKNAFAYIESQENLKDIVVSGGDAYYLPPHVLEGIGDRLIGMKNIERFRFATRGLAVAPNRLLDHNDPWTEALIRVSDKARKAGKHFALHTHFNHPNEISWITEKAARRLSQAAVTVRCQTVLLRGVNDDVDTMSTLIKKLAKMMIQPYYVYQCDMVSKVEHLRTPLQTSLDLESQIRGSIAGYYMPNFVVDLPEGGGKRLAGSFESYDRDTGVSTFRAPALTKRGKEGKIYKYYDPLKSSS
ncbi:L-lysine-aminomutase [Hypoxylon argillaceum]|nr:L-lysine-aminomutase [Hypoxylon argillaceum]